MKAKHFTYMAAAMIVAGAGTAAQAAWVAPTGGWQVDYEASSGVRPDDATPAWGGAPFYSDGSNPTYPSAAYIITDATSSEQTLHLNNSSNYSSFSNFRSPSGGLQSDLVTLDFRFRLIETTGRQFNMAVNRPYNDTVGGNTNISFSLGFDPSGIFNYGDGTTTSAALGNTWHDARWLIDINNKTSELFLDGSSTPIASFAGALNTTGYNFTQFGDGSSTISGQVNVTYVRYTNDGLAAVPEPASFGLLLAGGSLCLLKRRRDAAA